MDQCKWVKSGGDYWEVCQSVPEPTAHPDQDKGSWFGWLLCTLGCSSYTGQGSYDWKVGKCECRGDFRPPMWRR